MLLLARQDVAYHFIFLELFAAEFCVVTFGASKCQSLDCAKGAKWESNKEAAAIYHSATKLVKVM
jgi:hypothetical protein